MNVTAKAFLLEANTQQEIKPIQLVQGTIARTRAIKHLTLYKRALLDTINHLFIPITRQGYSSLWYATLSESPTNVEPANHEGWFACRYRQKTIAWWKIDRCTLEQLASSYYGSLATPLSSPLRHASHSELRLVKRLLSQIFANLPFEDFDHDEIEVEIFNQHNPVEASALWEINFTADSIAPPLQLYLAPSLLTLVKDAPSHQLTVDQDLTDKLAKWLDQTPISLTLTLGHQELPVDSLQQLAVGDILPISLSPRSIFSSAGKHIFSASVHSHHGRMVAKLIPEQYNNEEYHLD